MDVMPALVLYDPERRKNWTLTVSKESFTIGRAKDADVQIPLPGVSKHHVAVERKGGRFFFRDLGSKNGVYVNGFRAERGALGDGDEIQIGGVRITFYRKEAPPTDSGDSRGEAEVLPDIPEEELSALETLLIPGPSATGPEAPEPDSAPAEELGGAPPSEAAEAVPTRAPEPASALVEPSGTLEAESPLDLDVGQDLDLDAELPPHPRTKHAPRRHPSRSLVQRRVEIPAPGLALLVVLCVGCGILLGFLGAKLDRRDEEPSAPSGGGAASPAPKAETPALGGPVSTEDPPAWRRLIFRLHIDFVGRPPLRGELLELLSLPLEEMWLKVETKARHEGRPPDETVPNAFPRYLGRKAEPAEERRILDLARNDPKYFVFHVTTSKAYADPTHRRKRSDDVLARSLYVDLLDRVPTQGETRNVVDAIHDPRGGLAAVAGLMVKSAGAAVGPATGEPAATWIREAWERFLLRCPEPDEVEGATALLARGPDGWRDVLRQLATRDEYREY